MLVRMAGKMLGIDYGAKRVGIALSDDARIYAFPKGIFPNNEKLLDAIALLAEKEGVSLFVLGESDNPAGGENTIMRRIGAFKRALEVRTNLPVEEVSEAFSSAEARRALETKTNNRKEKEIHVDAAAAAIILQKYIDTHIEQFKITP